jgi:hypothetical protein
VLVEATRRGAGLLRRLVVEHFGTIKRLGRAFLPPLPGKASRPKSGRAR